MTRIAEGARYEISVDGTVRTLRGALEIALEAANVLKVCNRYSNVVIRAQTAGKIMEFAYQRRRLRSPHSRNFEAAMTPAKGH